MFSCFSNFFEFLICDIWSEIDVHSSQVIETLDLI